MNLPKPYTLKRVNRNTYLMDQRGWVVASMAGNAPSTDAEWQQKAQELAAAPDLAARLNALRDEYLSGGCDTGTPAFKNLCKELLT